MSVVFAWLLFTQASLPDLRREVIVVDIVDTNGTVDGQCLNFLFIKNYSLILMQFIFYTVYLFII
jgi:hypothetical protein